MQDEVWCDVEGYVGRYQVSDMGRLRSVPFHQRYLLRNGVEAFRRTKSRILAQQQINSGYAIAHLHLNNIRTAILVHRLVARAFIRNPLNLPEVNHKNGRKDQNFAENLEWSSSQANHEHAVDIGLNSQAIRVRCISAAGAVTAHPSMSRAGQALGVRTWDVSRAVRTGSVVAGHTVEVVL